MKRHPVHEFRKLAGDSPIFDVRTPAEFAKGSIPGAVNLPLFEDEERVTVGTTYKQEGRHVAIREGLDIVGPRMRWLVEFVEERIGHPDEGGKAFVHCWRGGMRSGSVAWLLEMYGFETHVLEGGYKAYRNWALDRFADPPEMIVIGGRTGGGKTEILHELAKLGEPVIDLEGLGNHRGSAFGAVGLGDQPPQQDFENRLAARIDDLAGQSPIWIEDESRLVGHRCIPDDFFAAMRKAPVAVIQVPRPVRVERLVEVYGEADPEVLKEKFDNISKRLGLESAKLAKNAVERDDLASAANVALDYYDNAYDYGLAKRVQHTLLNVDNEPDYSPEAIARRLLELKESLTETK